MTICAEWDEVYRLTLFSGCKIEKMWWLKKLGERASAAGRRHLDPLLIMIYNFDGCRWGEDEKCFFGSDTELFLAWCAIIQGGFFTGYAQKVLKMAKSLPKKFQLKHHISLWHIRRPLLDFSLWHIVTTVTTLRSECCVCLLSSGIRGFLQYVNCKKKK